MKRRKKTKKTSGFPHFLKLYSTINQDSLIITDAGHDQISYELALQFFDFETIFEWWRSYDEDFILSELESELFYPFQSTSQEEILRIIEKLLMTYDWLPQEVPVLTAKAIYQEQRWLMLIDYYFRYLFTKASGVKQSKSAITLINSLFPETKQSALPYLAER